MHLPYRAGVAKCMLCMVAIDHMTGLLSFLSLYIRTNTYNLLCLYLVSYAYLVFYACLVYLVSYPHLVSYAYVPSLLSLLMSCVSGLLAYSHSYLVCYAQFSFLS